MKSEWQPIETAPATSINDDRYPETVIVWVADGGLDRKGTVAFGCVHLTHLGERRPKAYGYAGTLMWRITHWMPLPAPPEDKP